MIIKIVFALVSAIALPSQAAPMRYDYVAQIVYSDAKITFAGMHINAYIPDASLAKTIGEFIGIPGDETPVQFGHYALIDGCRRHSCIEKAAIVVDMRTRAIAAVALRNFECRHVVMDDSDIAAIASSSRKRATSRCNGEPILDVYVVRRSLQPEALRNEREQLLQLRKWGTRVGHQGEKVQILVRY